ncbi:bifunctional ADP-dependent NAD(P)H-hydrate dehydratase/NAD(P)H-hydrate epimerase [Sulfolobales archaeon HS-7]|nr:bifunctional ADP-dependent NAD(P)H-hydrate dehydratase/NAD(P)H-hydrate epimerase [Sulfolobales archaeon HS-7]
MDQITTEEMRILEINSEALGISTIQLMENAGKAVANKILEKVRTGKAYIFVGHGGKGGDGLAAARHLDSYGFDVTILLFGEIKHPAATVNLNIIRELDTVRLVEVKDVSELSPVHGDVIVDALLGTGFSGKPREPFRTGIDIFNKSKGYKVSIDIPSGVNPDTGENYGDHVIPDLVVTFHKMKRGLIGISNVIVESIGIPKEAELFTGPGELMVRMKPRPMLTKKGDWGRLLIIGGSETFSGAPTLAALGALRTGIDLVYVAAPEETAKIIAGYSPDLITIKLSGSHLNEDNIEQLLDFIKKSNVIILGPGLGTHEETAKAVHNLIEILKDENKRAIIDADALKLYARNKLYSQVVITPHSREFEIFFGTVLPSEIKERVNAVTNCAKQCECTVVAKGYYDVISDGSRVKLNKTGQPGMAVGGTGDILTGIIGALLTRHLPFEASTMGTFINGLAGSLAYEELRERISATDVIARIPKVLIDPLDAYKKRVYRRVI